MLSYDALKMAVRVRGYTESWRGIRKSATTLRMQCVLATLHVIESTGFRFIQSGMHLTNGT